MQLSPLRIGDLTIPVPIIQGGMGVKVSTSELAAAVADCGGAGTIAGVALGYGTPEHDTNFKKASRDGLIREIRQAKTLTTGVVGVNLMVALNNYEELVKTAVQEGTDFIVSGAGLPLALPAMVGENRIKLLPIVSSARAADLIIKAWQRRYHRLPDAIVVEGPMAGGHLGFAANELTTGHAAGLETITGDVIELVRKVEAETGRKIPVIAAGGIFDGGDIAKFLRLGAAGVQIASRFVATNECTVSDAFKQRYITATDEDVVIIKSPVGMPGRAIRTPFIDRVLEGYREPIACRYQCLKTCIPKTAPYCIAKALCNAVSGFLDKAVVFAGSNVPRIDRIMSVKELMNSLVAEATAALAAV